MDTLLARVTRLLDHAELPPELRAACDAVVSRAQQQTDFTYTDRPTFNKDQLLDEIASGKRFLATICVASEQESWITLSKIEERSCPPRPQNEDCFTFDEINELEKTAGFTFTHLVCKPPPFIQQQMRRADVSIPIMVHVHIYATDNEFVPVILSGGLSGPSFHLIYGLMYGYGLEQSVPFAERSSN